MNRPVSASRPPAPDQAERDAAIGARGVNVLVDAGAGTGKTTILVDRLVELVAPSDDAAAPLDLGRVAAITFTRKAAGELKLRIRQALLERLAGPGLSGVRRDRLARALAQLDTAPVGTIHSFADRLLRLRPMEARLSPSYDIAEETADLHRETFDRLLHAVETGTLAGEVAGLVPPEEARRAEAAFADALDAGIRAERRIHPWGEEPGLDRLVERLVETRDVPPVVPPPEAPDFARAAALVRELRGFLRKAAGDSKGVRILRSAAERLERAVATKDPISVLRELLRIGEPDLKKGKDFDGDAGGWDAYQAWRGDDRTRGNVREGSIRGELAAPFARELARRLVAAAPVAVAIHERVKARRQVVDQVDLLLRLRDLLRDEPAVRAELQALFDHVLVDEFQDTDPLQAEIVLFLCEAGTSARSLEDVRLAPGRLTVVGDPKQSIYRFRRADISVYARVREVVRAGPHLVARLTANFRSDPPLLWFLNGRFDELLGPPSEGSEPFDPDRGTVRNEPLRAGRAPREDSPPPVELLPLDAGAAKPGKSLYRALEARALAAWLRRLVEVEQRLVLDPATKTLRPVRYGDVAVLAFSTLQLPLLFPELDRLGIPYAPRGGTLFLEDALHRRFLLALRALADPDDGVAKAALLRAPFFAIDLDDLARERAAREDGAEAQDHPGVLRARAALDVVAALRRRRLDRSPGATARDLLERTGLGRAAALGPNGAQRLRSLLELCHLLDGVAAEGLDFDAATARLRDVALDPISLDPPRPVEAEAVQVLTVHQAKGLEFPVVALWDGCAELAARDVASTFVVDRSGARWALSVGGLAWSEPEGGGVAARERTFLDGERRRLVYVAATRARDLLLLPVAGDPPKASWIPGALAGPKALEDGADPALRPLAPFVEGAAPPPWAEPPDAPARPPGADVEAIAAEAASRWREAVLEAGRPRSAPVAASAIAHGATERRDPPAPEAPLPGEGETVRPPRRESRHGPVFGETVHLAIGHALREPGLSPGEAVARAAAATGLEGLRAEAEADVGRALAALEGAGLRRPPGPALRLEYPVAALLAEGPGLEIRPERRAADAAHGRGGGPPAVRLVGGYVDLLVAEPEGGLAVVDFKTDAPPGAGADPAATHPGYVEQVRLYARLLSDLGLAGAGRVRSGLLFTAEGSIRWV